MKITLKRVLWNHKQGDEMEVKEAMGKWAIERGFAELIEEDPPMGEEDEESNKEDTENEGEHEEVDNTNDIEDNSIEEFNEGVGEAPSTEEHEMEHTSEIIPKELEVETKVIEDYETKVIEVPKNKGGRPPKKK